MIHLFLALLKKLVQKLSTFIQSLEAKLKNVEQTVKTDITGLIKVATLNSLSVDANGNYTLNVSFHYKTLTGEILVFNDPAKQNVVITGTVPQQADPTVPLSADEQAQADLSASLLTQLQPIVKSLIPNAS